MANGVPVIDPIKVPPIIELPSGITKGEPKMSTGTIVIITIMVISLVVIIYVLFKKKIVSLPA